MNRYVVVLMLLIGAPRGAAAQDAPPAPGCAYLTCALRVSAGTVLAGADQREIGEFGMFSPPDLRALLAVSDSATHYLSVVEDNYRSGRVLGLVGALVAAGSIFVLERRHDEHEDWTSEDVVLLGVALGGTGFALWGDHRVRRAKDALSQAVWWYNASLVAR